MANTKIRKLLTLQDLEHFYSSRKKSFHFSTTDDAEAIVVQVPGTIVFSEDEYDPTLGLLPVHLQSCHIDINRNHSNISEDSMNQAIPSIYNRPILGYIHKLSDGSYDFAGHEMFINDDGEIEYEEIAVGTIPESCNAKLVYDKEKEKTYLEVDGFIYEEYTRAADILREKKQSKVSVELSLLDFSYDAKNRHLNIDKFYFSGVTILGVTRDGNETVIEEGMYGSNVKLKDFSVKNNSVFSNETEEMKAKLIEMQESINALLSRFNINEDSNESKENYGKEDNIQVEDQILVNEEVVEETTVEMEEVAEDTVEVTETESTEEATDTVTENESEEPVEETPEVVVEESVEEVVEEHVEVSEEFVEDNEDEEKDDVEDDEEDNDDEEEKKVFSRTFELSHDDIRAGIYALLQPYEEADNDWFWIMEVFDDRFVYQNMSGKVYGQKYSIEGDNIAFEGERYELFMEYLTESEKAELESMRSNYSSISAELNSYKEAEVCAQREAVFNDSAYAEFVNTEGFKNIKENINTYSVEDLRTACDLQFAKEVKAKGTFAFANEKKEEKKPVFFAFAQQTKDSSFLDGLLKK